ncbi:hypothetical protein GUITHDRAFT_144924 [Guillardia theta CCMP2712]|uniref:RNA polymerase II subunit B1 CTD phosphatase RPAP2 homolog n=1 Tax=Guillardia theta (strain CCMP2712) TaxID=905079 RepID=L1IMI9_GUITC|nr:hypothetical protein GUITHDRAFT_144924 [Guillardia theta CCMP2712]EKX37488.1 hypothetical protein GUITHDRAFT_144924 [Guillardia theta CCMP2712]|eukprot:XP_005824468.1 hypothetical protein GUITHDRAFT_144924 [Guillardia theta CCMP2712]
MEVKERQEAETATSVLPRKGKKKGILKKAKPMTQEAAEKRKLLEEYRKKIESQLLAKVERERKVLVMCRRLFENDSVSLEELEETGEWISIQDYEDATKERALKGLCGYPLCHRSLQDASKPVGKSQILFERRTVSSVKGRKYFCSEGCGMASSIFKGSLQAYRPMKDVSEEMVRLRAPGLSSLTPVSSLFFP